MNKSGTGGWWKIGLVVVLFVSLVREFIVRIFEVSQSSTILLNGRVWIDLERMYTAAQVACSIGGAAVILIISCILFGRERDSGDGSVCNAAIGTVIGFVILLVSSIHADIIQWIIGVSAVAGAAGFLMGMEKISLGGMYCGFGIIFGGSLMLSMTHGFGVGGGLLFVAFWIGLVAAGIGGLLGSIAEFAWKKVVNSMRAT